MRYMPGGLGDDVKVRGTDLPAGTSIGHQEIARLECDIA